VNEEVFMETMTAEPSVVAPSDEMEREVEDIIGQWGGDPRRVIMAMLAVQDKYRWLPPRALDYISRRMGVPKSQLYHIATFYKVFSLVPRGKHILQLCLGTACHVRGAPMVAEALQREHGIPLGGTSEDGLFTLERVNCVGACTIGPLLVVDGKHQGNMTQNRATAVVKRLKRMAKREEEPHD